MVQRLRFHTSIAGAVGSIPGGETKTPHAAGCSQNKQTPPQKSPKQKKNLQLPQNCI